MQLFRLLLSIYFITSLDQSVIAAHEFEIQSADKQPAEQSHLLSEVTSVSGLQSLIGDYLDQDWIQVREMAIQDIESFAYSPDGKYIAYSSIWRPHDGDVIFGQSSAKKQVRICDLINNKMHEINTPWNMGGASIELAFSQDGKYLALGQANDFYIVDSESPKNIVMDPNKLFSRALQIEQEYQWGLDGLKCMAFSPHNNYFAVVYTDGRLSIWDLTNMQNPQLVKDIKLEGSGDGLGDKFLFTQNNEHIVILYGYRRNYSLINIASGALKKVDLPLIPAAACALFKQSNKFVFPHKISDDRYGIGISQIGHTENIYYGAVGQTSVTAIAVISDKYIAVAYTDNDICIWDISNTHANATGKPEVKAQQIAKLPVTGNVADLYCSPDGKYLTARINIPTKIGQKVHTCLIKQWINMAVYLKKA